jgi:hypothetical protein
MVAKLVILAKANRVLLVCINEAHDVMQQGRNFRPKFVEVVTSIGKLFQASQFSFRGLLCQRLFYVMISTVS